MIALAFPRLPLTLSRYLASNYLRQVLIILAVLGGLVMVADVFELFRRSYGKDGASFGIIIEMAFLKLPDMLQRVLPFAMLIGTILSLTKLTRSSELVVVRSAGISVWQFLFPAALVALLLSMFFLLLVNPLASVMLSRYEQLEARLIKGQISLLSLSSSGLWLRQGTRENGETVIHALRAAQEDMQLFEVTTYHFSPEGKFLFRLDADSTTLHQGYWLLTNVVRTQAGYAPRRADTVKLPTELTPDQIQDSFAPPETLSFWELPGFIKTLQESGFAAQRHRVYWHSLMATPLLLLANVFIAAGFSLRPARQGKQGVLISLGLLTGFIIYFLIDVIHAFGLSGTLPPALAAWAPVLAVLAASTGWLLHQEDG